jgi:hypothetical protein
MVLILSSLGCQKIDQLTQFNMEYDETIVVPSSTGINLPFNILAPDVETNSASTFAVNDTRKDLIESILLTQLKLTLTSPPNEDFSFLESVEIYISAEGLNEIRIAWQDNIQSNSSNNLDLIVGNEDLKEFIKKDKFALRVKTVTDEVLSSDHEIDLHSVFFVDAKILGQ